MSTSKRLYIRIREPDAVNALARELEREGVEASRIRAYAAAPRADLRVKAVRWRSKTRALLQGAVVGGLAMLLIWPAIMAWAVLPALCGAAVGAGGWLAWTRMASAPVDAQYDALRAGEVVLAVRLEDDELGPLASTLSSRHPELMMLGTDPAGSPPFP